MPRAGTGPRGTVPPPRPGAPGPRRRRPSGEIAGDPPVGDGSAVPVSVTQTGEPSGSDDATTYILIALAALATVGLAAYAYRRRMTR